MSRRELILLGAAALTLVIAIVWYSAGRTSNQAAQAPDAVPTIGPQTKKPVAVQTQAQAKKNEAETKAMRKAFILQNAAGLTTIQRTGGALRLNVAIKTVPTSPPCSAGDVEAISQDMAGSSKPQLLVTAEPMSGNDIPVQAKPLTMAQLKHGFQASFDLPAVDKPTTLGIFLCKDTAGKGSCRDKTVKPINTILATYANNDPKTRKKFDASDKVYFFDFGVLAKDNVKLFPDTQAGKFKYEALSKYLSTQGSSPAEANKAVERVKDVNEKLSVFAPSVEGNKLTMKLAYGHLEKCIVKKTAH